MRNVWKGLIVGAAVGALTGAAADRTNRGGASGGTRLGPALRSGVHEAVGSITETGSGLSDQVKQGAHAVADTLTDVADHGRNLAAHGAGLASDGIDRARSATKATTAS
jgi:hypothetical protein